MYLCFIWTFILTVSLGTVNIDAELPFMFRSRPRGGMLGAPAANWADSLPSDQWLTQKLDHYNAADTRTWEQRYFVNSTFFKSGGPVFLLIGGEGEASPLWMVLGQWINYAQKYKAMCLQLEHRFYGRSRPTRDLSIDNMSYLNSEQALADIAHFVRNMTEVLHLTSANKWITFGGSYPGALSAWFRAKYPHMVHGAVSSSAPMLAILNFKDFLGVVNDALETTKSGPMCNQMIMLAVATIQGLLKASKGRRHLKNVFMLCNEIDPTNMLDISNLHAILAGNFEGIVQYNKDNRAFEGALATNITIDILCDIMTDPNAGDFLERYANVNRMLLKAYNQHCLDFRYNNMINSMQEQSWNSAAAEGARQWTYQTCTEFGYYQTSDLKKQPFGHFFPLAFALRQCQDIFGSQFTREVIQDGIDRSNENYGGYNIKVSRVVFVHGSIDPWHALGILKDISPSAKAIYINGTAHCANMYPASPSDLLSLKKARAQIDLSIGRWLKEG